MKHTLRLAPGKFVNLDSYKRPGVHSLFPLAAIAIIITSGVGAVVVSQVEKHGAVCPRDRSEYYGPGC
jgi:hypothetical protein